MTDIEITGPGDATRLVNQLSVSVGSTLRLEDGDADQVLAVELWSRTLASHDETTSHVFVMTYAQASYLAGQLMAAIAQGDT
jgi:hypothetical protein